jgi:hypothetical protein
MSDSAAEVMDHSGTVTRLANLDKNRRWHAISLLLVEEAEVR